MRVRLLSYNIRFGGIGREELLSKVINSCEPDVVILQEAIHPDVVKRLAIACKMKEWGSRRGHSLGFLSRIEIRSHEWHHARFAKRAYLELQLPQSGMRIFGVHLAAIHSNITEHRRVYELKSLLQDILAQHPGFHVIVGDFNTLAPGERLDLAKLPLRLRALAWLSGGSVRWRTIQLMLDGGYTDGFKQIHPRDPGLTFPTTDPHVRLDYLFIPTSHAAALERCEVVRHPAAAQASDHFPLLCEISAA